MHTFGKTLKKYEQLSGVAGSLSIIVKKNEMKLNSTAAIAELLLFGKKATTIKDIPKRVYE